MRRFCAIVRATAHEIASEPLALLLTMSALALAVITPALHYHQFGEPTRMARDAGFSALLIGGLAHVIFCTVKTFRREIESGTLQMALAHSVSRTQFFLAKLCGVGVAYLVFAVTIFAASLTVVNGQFYALAVMTLVVPIIVAAILNRFMRFRFTFTATLLSAVWAILAMVYRMDGALVLRFLPVALTLVFPTLLLATVVAAFAVRWKEHAALALTGVVFVLMLPLLGNYYLSDVLSKGGALAWRHVALALTLTAPLVLAFVGLGLVLFEKRDVGTESV